MEIKKGTKVRFPSTNPYNDGLHTVQSVEITIRKNGSWHVTVVMSDFARYTMNGLRRLYRAGKVEIWN